MADSDPRSELTRLIAEAKGETLTALSRLIGRNDAYLQQFLRRGTPRRLAEADRRTLAQYFGVSETLLGGSERSIAETVGVPRLGVRASAGPGALNPDEQAIDAPEFPLAMLRRLGVGRERLALIVAEGESMEPLIRAGDQLLVDQGDTTPASRAAVFVLRAGDTLLVKRVRRHGATLDITSDNPAAPPVREPVEIVGKVVWLSRAL